MIGKYDVGQVLYILSKKERRVYPVLVVEELVRRTLDGVVTSYNVKLPDRKGTTLPLETVTDSPYSSHNELRDLLVQTATESINSMINEAVSLGETLAPAGAARAGQAAQVEDAPDEHPEDVFVELPDGTRARLKK